MQLTYFFRATATLCVLSLIFVSQGNSETVKGKSMTSGHAPAATAELEVATFGAGCFWCVEAVFQQLAGVVSVVSGYSGGLVEDPTYEQVCSGRTGHAEVCQIRFDPQKVSYEVLLAAFWKTHDPTTLNRQGPDYGTQYRSVVFYHNEEQKAVAQKYWTKLNASGAFAAPLVTEIVPFKKFFPAESYHQDYYQRNSRKRYCSEVIRPKLDKFKEVFADKLSKD